ncbi:MAG: hypothetical protein GEV11_13665 [Streptosporangiales bacterium]|nr:hypothetical protein [Streptosporangiales bacterium]
MIEVDEFVFVRTFLDETDGDARALFVIDERDYPDPGAAWDAYLEAGEEMDRMRRRGVFDSRELPAGSPRTDLPTWREYAAYGGRRPR